METLRPGISSVDLEVIPLTDLRRDSRKIIVSISIANKLSKRLKMKCGMNFFYSFEN